MTPEEKHNREMNIAAHLTWGAGFLCSGEAARVQGNVLASAISLYYCVFHAGFAMINTDHTFNMGDMSRIHHNKVELFLEQNLPPSLQIKAKQLRITREFLNYLGADNPASKLRIVRGHPVVTDLGTNNIEELVNVAARNARTLFEHIYGAIESFCSNHNWQPLQYGKEHFVGDYLDDDLFLNVFPRSGDGARIYVQTVKLLLDPQSTIASMPPV